MLVSSMVLSLVLAIAPIQRPVSPETPEDRAVAFLTREVPKWARENRCYSCHNNGDAARALFQASRKGYRVPDQALADTTGWLLRPAGWDHNGGEGAYSDKRLARVAFTYALATATLTGWIRDRSVLVLAAERLALDQAPDGSWPIDGEDNASSPATYGRPLATFLARESLVTADPVRFRTAIERADGWLSSREVSKVTDAAIVWMNSSLAARGDGAGRRQRSLELLRRAQSNDGGWGPEVASPPETFDTALVLLSLAKDVELPEVRNMVSRGRGYLIAQQQPDGSWNETTRPPGNVSYAQRISTTGWATLALLRTSDFAVRSGADAKR